MQLGEKVRLGYAFGASLLSWLVDGPPRPFSATFAVTNRCNLRCSYCYASRLRATAQAAVEGGFDAFSAALLYDRRSSELYRAGPLDFEGVEDQLRDAAVLGVSYVDPATCVACATCIKTCPYGAPMINALGKAEIQGAKCMGCGSCVAVCPARAIALQHQESRTTVAMLEEMLAHGGRG